MNLDQLVHKLGYDSKFQMFKSFAWDIIVILILVFLIKPSLDSATCVSGQIAYDQYNECLSVQSHHPELFEKKLASPFNESLNFTIPS